MKEKKISFARELYDTVEILVMAACVVLLLYSFVFRLCKVSGDSMLNTLENTEMLLVSNINYTPEGGDIIVFHQTTPEGEFGFNEPIVKRVIATEGQTIDIDFDTWTVKITDTDGSVKILDESEYMFLEGGVNLKHPDCEFPLTVPDGKIFVMGDNRNNSTDSRSYLIGCVDVRRVIGKALVRLTPFNKFGTLY